MKNAMTSEKQTQTVSSDTGPIFRLIRRVRQLLRGSWVATGLALSIAIYLGTLLTLALLDLLVPFWPAMRVIALVLVIVPSVWVFFTGVLRPLFRRLGNTQVARKIETHLPGIHNRLVSCVDLSDDARRNGHSPEFYRRLVSEALERIRGFRPQAVLDRRHLRRAATALGFTLAIFIACCFLLSDRLPTAMARIFRPWADIPPATGVEFTVTPGDAKVPRGDEIEFAAHVTKGEPRDMRVEIVPDDGGETIWHDFIAHGASEWSRTLAGLETSFRYRVHGGGTWSRQYHMTMVDRPRIEDLQVVLHYPGYFELGEAGAVPQPTPDVTGPETSEVEVRVRSEGDVAEGEIQLLDVAWDKITIAQRDQRVWFDGALPKGAVGEGNWQWNDDKLLAAVLALVGGATPEESKASADAERQIARQSAASQPAGTSPADSQPTDPANGKKAHTEPPAAGVHGHRFHTAPVGFLVEPGEYLFAWVYLVPNQRPESILLEWHDGQNWEHRVFWGDDKIGVGQPNTTSRHAMGALPKAGEWTRLEVPAKDVGLTNKSIKGMGFTLHGGQCLWGPAGAVPSPTRDERRLVVKQAFPLTSTTPSEWSGTFPLVGTGLYRVELRNELKYSNQAMKEAKFTAIADNPPQVTIERPGTDLVLSQPKKVPLTIAAYDDFALKHLRVLLQRGDSEGFREVVHKKYSKQKRGDTALVALDLLPLDLKPNEQVRYRAQVEDRKGQVAETRDYIIRIAADGNAADQQLARFEQTQDAFQQKLAQLIAEQAKVKENVEKLAQDYAPLEKKIEEAEAKATQDAAADPAAQANKPPVTLDPETQKKLDELRQKLAEAAGKEEQNANVGKQLVNELAEAVKQADQLRMLPPELVSEMNAAQQAFDQLAARPMEDLAKDLRQASTPNQTDPNLADMADASQHVQAELEAIAARLKALENARKNMDGGLDEALAKLRDELMRQEAAGAERGLDELRDMLAALREQLQKFEGQQSDLLDATNVTPDMLMAELEKRQGQLERASDPPLEEARELVGRKPRFPDAPAMGEEEEMTTPPEEADTPEADEPGEPGEHDPESGEEMEEDEPLYEPSLGGPRPKLDPRFADKRPRPTPEAKTDPARQAREQLADRQFQRLEELNLGQQSLAADERALEALMEELRQALGEPPPGMEAGDMAKPGEPHPPGEAQAGEPSAGKPSAGQESGETGPEDAAAQQLSKLLESSAMRQAMELAQRIRQMRAELAARQAGQPQKGPARTSRGRSLGNLAPTTTSGTIVEVELSKLDPSTRAIVLKMQPRMREELLQGMREQGPEGYRKFIQDYFKRLTEVKQP
jgi:hypothetical protein